MANFHNRPDLAVYRREYFTAYKSYNAEVVELLSKEICGDDLIWVHDYHHLAVGRMLKEAGYLNQCGLLLHQPFPAGDIFRTLSEHSGYCSLFFIMICWVSSQLMMLIASSLILPDITGPRDYLKI